MQALMLALLSTSVAFAPNGPLTDVEALHLFLEQSPQARRVPLLERSADAAMRAQARVANPEFSYQIEEAGGVRDEFVTFEQELPVTGRRTLLGRRAQSASIAVKFEAERRLQLEAYELKRLFYEILYREGVVDRLRQGIERLQGTVGILGQREREGEASGYDLLRAEQELAELRVTAESALAGVTSARSRFAAFYDPELKMDSVRLTGDLFPADPPPATDRATEHALEQRLDLRSLSSERERLEFERRAARRRHIPEPILTAGLKRTEMAGLADSGYVAALRLPLPIFDRGRLDAARAGADGERVELEAEMLKRRIRADVQAALAREQAARRAAAAYGADVEGRAAELHSIARLRYDEGESGILELLDAHRTALAMELRSLETAYEARSAAIDRDRSIGNEVKP